MHHILYHKRFTYDVFCTLQSLLIVLFFVNSHFGKSSTYNVVLHVCLEVSKHPVEYDAVIFEDLNKL